MALIAVAIGVAGSGKSSTTVPMLILFFSFFIQVGVGMTQMFAIAPTNQTLENKDIDQMNSDLNSGKIKINVMDTYYLENPNPDSNMPSPVYQVTKFVYIDKLSSYHFIEMGLNIFSLSDAIDVYINDNRDYPQSLYIRNKENVANTNSNYDYVINEFILNGVVSNFKTYISNIIKNIGSVGASGIVAVNYLSPFSALAAICGTGSAPLSVQSNHKINIVLIT